jgi:phosphoribosylglycinamide formyltransferase-1
MPRVKRIVVLISGRGSNLEALLAASHAEDWARTLRASVVAVISNRPDAAGLAIARDAGIATHAVDHRGYASRESFDAALADAIDAERADWVVLAGFMRVLGLAFVDRYAGRLVNIHPSLLPAFPGLDTHARALAAGVRVHGATVHFVSPQVDHGAIVAQAVVRVLPGDDAEALAARVLAQEHRLLPHAVRLLVAGAVRWERERVVVGDATAGELALLAA